MKVKLKRKEINWLHSVIAYVGVDDADQAKFKENILVALGEAKAKHKHKKQKSKKKEKATTLEESEEMVESLKEE